MANLLWLKLLWKCVLVVFLITLVKTQQGVNRVHWKMKLLLICNSGGGREKMLLMFTDAQARAEFVLRVHVMPLICESDHVWMWPSITDRWHRVNVSLKNPWQCLVCIIPEWRRDYIYSCWMSRSNSYWLNRVLPLCCTVVLLIWCISLDPCTSSSDREL